MEDHIKKKKWVSTKDFRTVGGQESLNIQERSFVPNYVMRDPSNPPILHNFRKPVDKTKFVDSKPFVIFWSSKVWRRRASIVANGKLIVETSQ